MQQRREYLDQLEKLKGSISVYCRVRPLNSEENGDGQSTCFFPRPQVIELRGGGGGGGVKSFTYNEVFGPGSSQSDIFKSVVDPLVQDVLEGYNVCIFAYGQTGSGKTYTMAGIPGDPVREGVVPRSLRKMFLVKEHAAAKLDVKLTFTMVDLFKETLIDLLKGFTSPDHHHRHHHGEMHQHKLGELAVKKDLAGLVGIFVFIVVVFGQVVIFCFHVHEVYIENATSVEVQNENQMNALIKWGESQRRTDRSHSHLMMNLNVESKNRAMEVTTLGKLTLADLCGSDKISKNNGEDCSKVFSKSFSALNDVLQALTSAAKHVPYENHPVRC